MIYVLSGSADNPYAVIGVTYPSGATCTCTNGSKTLTAKDTTGKALFVIPSAGTWTVTAVSGSKSKSKTVSITAGGQVETVTLTYEMILFDNGLVDGIAWDYVYHQDNQASSAISDVIKLYSWSWDNNISLQRPQAIRGISSAINLSDYSMLKIRTKACPRSEGDAELHIGSSNGGYDLGEASIIKTADQITSINVSAITKNSFISVWAQPGNEYGNVIDIRFDKVWLE